MKEEIISTLIKSKLLNGKELSFAISGTDVNLRVRADADIIYMRIEQYQAASVPLCSEVHKIYSCPELEKVLDFGFKTDLPLRIDELSDILATMKERPCKPW